MLGGGGHSFTVITVSQSACVVLVFSHNELLESDIEDTVAELRVRRLIPLQVVNVNVSGTKSPSYLKTLSSEKYADHAM